MSNGISGIVGKTWETAVNTANTLKSFGNKSTSNLMWLTGSSLQMIANTSNSTLDSTMALTSMQDSLMHKVGQTSISVLNAGASLSRVYDLVSGNTSTTPDEVLGNTDKLIKIESRVREVVDENNSDASPEIMQVINKMLSLASHVQNADSTSLTRSQYMGAVFSGAHVVVSDGGKLFKEWASTPGINWENRQSSHYQQARSSSSMIDGIIKGIQDKFSPLSKHPQKGIDLPGGLGHLLIGRTDNGDTFFQLEAHGTSARDFLPHMMDFFLHKASGNAQVGPLGLIQMTEKPDVHGARSNLVVTLPDHFHMNLETGKSDGG